MLNVQNDFVKKFQQSNPDLFRLYQDQNKIKWELTNGTKYVTTDCTSVKNSKNLIKTK